MCPSNFVLHYDVMRTFDTTIADYASDPDLLLLSRAREVTVVFLAASPESLVAQLKTRPPKTRRLDWLLAPLGGWARARLGYSSRPRTYDKHSEHARHARLVQRYAEPGFLDAWYRSFEEFLREHAAARLASPPIHIELVASPVPTFRLAQPVSRNLPASDRYGLERLGSLSKPVLNNSS